jgi:putative transcriptional regulator
MNKTEKKRQVTLKLFGARVKALRAKKNMAQADLARIMDKDRQSVQRVEGGNINPSIIYLSELADGLKIPLSELMDFRMPRKKRK